MNERRPTPPNNWSAPIDLPTYPFEAPSPRRRKSIYWPTGNLRGPVRLLRAILNPIRTYRRWKSDRLARKRQREFLRRLAEQHPERVESMLCSMTANDGDE